MEIPDIRIDFWVQTRCILIEPLDEFKKPIQCNGGTVKACGFITHGVWDGASGDYPPIENHYHLYTCWHVVTGHDPRVASTPTNYVRRCHLKITGIGVNAPNSVSGTESFIIPLFDEQNTPLWEQEKEETSHEDFNNSGIRVPKSQDVIRIDVNLNFAGIETWAINATNIADKFFELGEDVFVCGFPYGYSTRIGSIAPVFLKRNIASIHTNEIRISLLDSGCAPVMSGGPVFKRDEDRWRLIGMYSGTINLNPSSSNSVADRFASLGSVMNFTMIKQSIGSVRMPFAH